MSTENEDGLALLVKRQIEMITKLAGQRNALLKAAKALIELRNQDNENGEWAALEAAIECANEK